MRNRTVIELYCAVDVIVLNYSFIARFECVVLLPLFVFF